MSLINKVILFIVTIMGLAGAGVVYYKMSRPEPVAVKSVEAKKGNVKRKITKPSGEVIEETEVYEVKSSSETKPIAKNYLLGLTLGYDFDLKKQTYALIFGRYLFLDIYLIGKIETTRIEGGLIWTF